MHFAKHDEGVTFAVPKLWIADGGSFSILLDQVDPLFPRIPATLLAEWPDPHFPAPSKLNPHEAALARHLVLGF
jgi:hypothetical protein